eukprot:77421_1
MANIKTEPKSEQHLRDTNTSNSHANFIDLCSSEDEIDDQHAGKKRNGSKHANIRLKRAQEEVFCVLSTSICDSEFYDYVVRSYGSGRKYTVKISRNSRECTCPDFELNKKPCKHIYYC